MWTPVDEKEVSGEDKEPDTRSKFGGSSLLMLPVSSSFVALTLLWLSFSSFSSSSSSSSFPSPSRSSWSDLHLHPHSLPLKDNYFTRREFPSPGERMSLEDWIQESQQYFGGKEKEMNISLSWLSCVCRQERSRAIYTAFYSSIGRKEEKKTITMKMRFVSPFFTSLSHTLRIFLSVSLFFFFFSATTGGLFTSYSCHHLIPCSFRLLRK